MDRLAQEDLHTTAGRLREISVSLGATHTSASRAVSRGGPDFRSRITALIGDVDALAADIVEVAGPLEKREGIRKVTEHSPTCSNAGCIICMARKDTGAQETTRENGPHLGRAGYGG